MEREIAEGLGKDEGTVAGVDGSVVIADMPEILRHIGGEPSQPALITQGLSNQEIAERSYLSINSVKTYIRSAYRKINATSTRPVRSIWRASSGWLSTRLSSRPG